jgi:hypothetical protein
VSLRPIAITLAALLALALKLLLALTTYGTNDVSYWAWFLEQLRASGGSDFTIARTPRTARSSSTTRPS